MPHKLKYEKAIQMEGEYWGQKLTGVKPDYRLRQRKASLQNLWDDPDVENLTRNTYKKCLLYPSKLKGLRILELGCGDSWLALELARQGHDVDAYDISRAAIKLAKSYYQEVRNKEEGLGKINYYIYDLNKIELPRDNYNLAVCWDSLHHILESKRLMQQVYSSLIIGGKFLAFDHIGQESRLVNIINLTFLIITLILAPQMFISSVYRKIKQRVIHKSPMSDEDKEQLYSPFEDITGKEMINYFIEAFGQQQVIFETTLAFGASWLARIRGPQKLRLAEFFCEIDLILKPKLLLATSFRSHDRQPDEPAVPHIDFVFSGLRSPPLGPLVSEQV